MVDVGNPHVVLFGDELVARLPELGPRLETHPAFPNRTNVEIARFEAGRLVTRVWERGVGETLSCGSGACATALAAASLARVPWPVRVAMPGAELVVDLRAGSLHLAGPVEAS